jgi:high-affinity nickel-transport protein
MQRSAGTDLPDLPARARPYPLFAALTGANLLAWAWAWTSFGDNPVLLGTAFLAWVFGLRHAVDADHIAAIDNVTRALMQRPGGPDPSASHVGLYFSLGHSAVVFLAVLAIGGVVGAAGSELEAVKAVLGPLGVAVSSLFLLLVAALNVAILRGVWRSFRAARAGRALAPDDLNMLLAGTGPLARLLRPVLRGVRHSWHMFPVGLLFGLGFDTATEVGLLGIAAGQTVHGLSAWQILIFPALFATGMALVDTADTVMMVRAYGWAFVHPLRKLWYNLTVTAASVLVALLIGGVEMLGLLADVLELDGWVWRAIGALNQNIAGFGFLVMGIFAACWAVSAAIYRWKDYDAAVERA